MAEAHSTLVKEVVEQFGADRSRLMDIARALHGKLGHLSEDIIGEIADALGIHRVEVRDMVSFYAFLSRSPKGKTTIRLCNAVVERMNGADEIAQAFEEALGIRFGETTPDGAISLEYTACMGMSDQAPSALVNGVPITGIRKADVPAIIDAIKKDGAVQSLPVAEIDLNLRQSGPVIFAPMDRGAAVRRAVDMTPDEIIATMNTARLRGRGGAGFPLAMKWDFCRKAKGDAHYVICNADEGEPGTFKDRVILTEQPDVVFEGMTVAAFVVGAHEGFLYLRAEYEYLLPHLEQVLARRRRLGLLGDNICGREGFNFDIRVQVGAGAYICGEESALIESLEGKPGKPRNRPPFPDRCGYRNQPTVVNNVETFACAARIAERGAAAFTALGTPQSTGSKLISVSGDCQRPGIYEVPFGVTVRQILIECGAEDAHAVQVSGPSGTCISFREFDRIIAFEDLPTAGAFMVFSRERDMFEVARNFSHFFAHESCGFCTPCRVGTSLLRNTMDKLAAGKGSAYDMNEMKNIMRILQDMAHCGLGHTAANPVVQTMEKFPDAYEKRLMKLDFEPAFDLDGALQTARLITGRDDEWAHLAND